MEEIEIEQDFVKDIYIRGAENEEKGIDKKSIKKENYYVDHLFTVDKEQKFNVDYIRNNGQAVVGKYVNEFSAFVEEYFK